MNGDGALETVRPSSTGTSSPLTTASMDNKFPMYNCTKVRYYVEQYEDL